jgi:putative ABC transport system permease protein
MNFWDRKSKERELEAELRAHLRASEIDRLERGQPAEEARQAAVREFGNRTIIAETTRDMWGWGPFERLGKDLRYSARALRRSPGFAATAIGTLALGIGATTAFFSAIEATLLRPLPYANPQELVWITRPSPNIRQGFVLTPVFSAWRAENRAFADLAGWNDQQFNLTGVADAERIVAASVNAGFLKTLGVSPFLGRDFELEQDRGADKRYAMLGHELWRRVFRGDPAVIGRQLKLNDAPFTVVGILPPGFLFPGDIRPEVLVPGGYSDSPDWGASQVGLLRVVGRPRPGVTKAQMREDLAAIDARHQADWPASRKAALQGGVVRLTQLSEQIAGNVRRPLLVLWGAVSLVLLLICANIAGLQLARASSRSDELALRAALGAGRGRLMRLVIGESLLVAFAGGALGIAGAMWLVRTLRTVAAFNLPAPEAVQLNGTALGFALATTLMAGLLAGLAPALNASRADLATSLKTGSRSLTRGWRGGLRRVLVVSEVAMALVLLLGAGLLLRSMWNLLTTPLGIDPEGVVTLRVRLSGAAYKEDAARASFMRELVARTRALPGVTHAAMTNSIPLTGHNLGMMFRIEGQPEPAPGEGPGSGVLTVTSDYFATAGVPLLAGRNFRESDTAGSEPVLVVNRSFADKFFAGQPLDRRIAFGNVWARIVGVVADTRQNGPAKPMDPEIFRPMDQMPAVPAGLMARTSMPPESLIGAMRAVVRQMDPNLAVFDVQTMDGRISSATASQRLQLVLVAFFAAIATLVAALGVYGVISYAVSQTINEIGLRLALGASPSAVQRAVVARGLWMGLAGVALGLAGGYALTRYLRTLLFETGEHDLATFALAPSLLLAVALLATWLPARRASRVDPVIALRYQ